MHLPTPTSKVLHASDAEPLHDTACVHALTPVLVAGMATEEATSAGQDSADETPGEEVDLRDSVYEMLRPTEWSAEASEPAGEPALLEVQRDGCR